MSSPVQRRRLNNRREILDELAASESRYVKKLRSIVNAYLNPLKESRVLTTGEHGSLFRSMQQMYQVHSKLNDVIQRASEEDNVVAGVAIAAAEFQHAKAALLELYLPYARGHGTAIHVLRSALTRPDVSRALEATMAGDERVRGVPLPDLLAVPLDRVGDYRDLTAALLTLSAPTDSGYAAIADSNAMFTAIGREAQANGYESGDKAAASSSVGGGAASSSSVPAPADVPSTPAGRFASIGADNTAPPSSSASSNRFGADSILAAAMPLSSASSSMAHSPSKTSVSLIAGAADGPTADEVLASQAEAEEAARRLEALEREVALHDEELRLVTREVVRAEGEKGTPSGDRAADASTLASLETSLEGLKGEEQELLTRLAASEHRALFEAFLARKRELEDEEQRLTAALAEHEDTLAKVRARLANPPASVLPSDPAKASLYIAWKRALAEREELLRQARARKHTLLRDLKTRHETQVVLLECERRAAVSGLQASVESERVKVDGYKKELAALDESIESARGAMARFRQEFEQLRVALLIDRMAKSSQVANLADRRRRLAREADAFQEAVEAAKQRVAGEEAAKWEQRLAGEKAACEARVAEERALIEQKIDKVKQALAERYEAGFKPLLAEAESRHRDEVTKLASLQRELEEREQELRNAHEAARAVSAAVASLTGGEEGAASPAGGEGGSGEGGASVPEWKVREFSDLRNAVCTMWETLDVPSEDITAFLSECDLLAPYSPRVLAMYQDMYKRLTNAAAAAAVTQAAQQQAAQRAAAAAVSTATGAASSPSTALASSGVTLSTAPPARGGGAGAMPQPHFDDATATGSSAPSSPSHGVYEGGALVTAAREAGYSEAALAASHRALAAAIGARAAPTAQPQASPQSSLPPTPARETSSSAPSLSSSAVLPATPASQAGSTAPTPASLPSATPAVGSHSRSTSPSQAGAYHGAQTASVRGGAQSTTGHSTAGGAGGGFRTTLFSPQRRPTVEEAAAVARLAASKAALPPSLGGPGARSVRGHSIHVAAGNANHLVRRSPSPSAATRALAQATLARQAAAGGIGR